MKIPAQYWFHLLEETKRVFTWRVEPAGLSESSEAEHHLHFVVTKRYAAMKQFFTDLGFEVPEQDDGWQVVPVFNHGRACLIRRGLDLFCLEESTHTASSGPIYLEIGDIGVARLLKLKPKYHITDLDGGCLQIEPPDGGAVVFTART